MLANVLTFLVLILIASAFGFLSRRALRLRNPAARWSLAVLAALPGLLLVLVVGIMTFGYSKLYLPRSRTPLALDTSPSPARVERGAHLARTTCVACHTKNNQLPLSGGNDLSADVSVPIGTLVPPNLTPGGPLKDWTDEDIAQAIRNGRHQNGRTLMMPTNVLRNLSDEDVASLVVFLRSQPAVEHETPPLNASPIFAMLLGTGLVNLDNQPVTEPVVAPAKEPTVSYGGYVVSYQDCTACHGEDLNGSSGGLGPDSPGIRSIVRHWTAEQFIQTMRTGVDPAGHAIQPPMPWQMIGQMDDVELTALYLYLRGEQ